MSHFSIPPHEAAGALGEAERTSSGNAIIVWLRTDLRLHDHEPLLAAVESGRPVVLVYCLDPRQFEAQANGVPRTGVFRAQFLLESLTDLRRSSCAIGGDLVVRVGEPEHVVGELAELCGAQAVYVHGLVAPEERDDERRVAERLHAQGVVIRTFAGHSMLHADDLPFAVAALPDTFSKYRNIVERRADIRAPLPAPTQLHCAQVEPGHIPSLAELGFDEASGNRSAPFHFVGGTTAGQKRLTTWIWEHDALRRYKRTRNGMLAPDDSSRLSPWLALGCLSAREVHAEVQRYERERVRNEDTQWLIFELHWRDYFYWVAARWGRRLFAASGLQGLRYPWRTLDDAAAREDFARWTHGETGFPLVDAAMRELSATGYTSNRARQNVASFLTRVLGIDWREGARWFESLLVDYDVGSNWGNWAYVAGVGNDARGFRFFNVQSQGERYDPAGAFAQYWVPELSSVADARIYRPDRWTAFETDTAASAGYPAPMVDLYAAADASSARYEQATGERQAVGTRVTPES